MPSRMSDTFPKVYRTPAPAGLLIPVSSLDENFDGNIKAIQPQEQSSLEARVEAPGKQLPRMQKSAPENVIECNSGTRGNPKYSSLRHSYPRLKTSVT